MIADADVKRAVKAARRLPPAASEYLEDDFVMNLLLTVLDYQMHTNAVVKARDYFRANRSAEVRNLDDLDAVLSRYPDDQVGNTELAGYLWGNRHWTRAHQLRDLERYTRASSESHRGGELPAGPLPTTQGDALKPLNECAACGADFTSLELFDRHRAGRHEPDLRRCLSTEEMTTRGWQRDSRRRWTNPARALRARRKFAVAA